MGDECDEIVFFYQRHGGKISYHLLLTRDLIGCFPHEVMGASGKETDTLLTAFCHYGGIFERMPDALVQESCLRMHDLCLYGAILEEVCIKVEFVFYVTSFCTYVFWVLNYRLRDTCGAQFVIAEHLDAIDPSCKCLPKLTWRLACREVHAHPNDGDVVALSFDPLGSGFRRKASGPSQRADVLA